MKGETLIGLHYSQLGRLAAWEMMSSVDCGEIGERLERDYEGKRGDEG
jgi:hypothetical protein